MPAILAHRPALMISLLDMGGTTASASLIKDGKITRSTEYEFRDGISTPSRFIKAGGYLMRVLGLWIAADAPLRHFANTPPVGEALNSGFRS